MQNALKLQIKNVIYPKSRGSEEKKKKEKKKSPLQDEKRKIKIQAPK